MCVVFLVLTATVALPAAVLAVPTLDPWVHYRLGEEDPAPTTVGQPPSTGLSYDEIKYAGTERDVTAFGQPVYSDFVPPGGYSTLSMKFDGASDLYTNATQWHTIPINGTNPPATTFRVGMEAFVWVDPK